MDWFDDSVTREARRFDRLRAAWILGPDGPNQAEQPANDRKAEHNVDDRYRPAIIMLPEMRDNGGGNVKRQSRQYRDDVKRIPHSPHYSAPPPGGDYNLQRIFERQAISVENQPQKLEF